MIKTTKWTASRTGQVRHYLDNEDVWDAMPAEDSYGAPYKNADYHRIQTARFWLSDQGVLNITGLVERGRIAEADVRAAIVEAGVEYDGRAWDGGPQL